ncbi:GNAT family N-acetyltransferase [uncultured Roseibium sp.]|uniref:GNAT family N-acetyltransferase n=1 Tax=uncultured Roseibium sp. TaxID=1936171 RepID=UPI002601986E|nr:GNAT family N-acetyltransferase [uncultured Roseibium sp.]
MSDGITIVPGFPEDQRPVTAGLFWQAFRGKLGKVLSPERKAMQLIERILDPDFAISALGREGDLLGLAGFKTAKGALVAGELSDMTAVFGPFGGFWRGMVLDVLERDVEPGILLMDGIFVSERARGQGIGTKLLDAVCIEAQRQQLSRVRLDVIDTNPRARALYERQGFMPLSREETGPLKYVFGFSSATRMERPV